MMSCPLPALVVRRGSNAIELAHHAAPHDPDGIGLRQLLRARHDTLHLRAHVAHRSTWSCISLMRVAMVTASESRAASTACGTSSSRGSRRTANVCGAVPHR
jgi:hypothetical protein